MGAIRRLPHVARALAARPESFNAGHSSVLWPSSWCPGPCGPSWSPEHLVAGPDPPDTLNGAKGLMT